LNGGAPLKSTPSRSRGSSGNKRTQSNKRESENLNSIGLE
jgi:hypothetical protein